MKAIAFDLDDTLLHDDLSISDETVEILQSLHRAGKIIVPASGRTQASMKEFLDRIACADWFISSNGSEVWDGNTHRILHQETFSSEIGREIARFGERYHCYMHTYAEGCFYYSEHSERAEKYAEASRLKGVFVGPLSSYIHEPRNKILFIDSEERIEEMLNEARRQFARRLSVTCSKPYFLEFNPLSATKGNALKLVSDLAGISCSDFVSFGDSLNDLSMLELSGLSVAVSNARPEVRRCCKAVCGSNNDDGVARFLYDLFSGEGISV